MLIKLYQLIFSFTLAFGTFMACSSSSWVLAWIGLEINLMSFIPLLIKNLNQSSMELAIKYFLVQAMASLIIIFSTVSPNMLIMTSMNMDLPVLISNALAMKAGVAPFHFWFPQVMAYADWIQASLILTWQKIAPLILISFSFNLSTSIIIILSALIGMLGGLNQTCLKKILTYSSIIHSAWLISVAFISDSVWWMYFLAYCSMTISIITPLNFMKTYYLNQINMLKLNFTNKLLIFLNILSLAGLPPLLGFFIKMMSINSMLSSNINLIIILSLITSSLVSFYFYSRLMYSSFLLNENHLKLISPTPQMKGPLFTFLIISLLGNMFLSFLVLVT